MMTVRDPCICPSVPRCPFAERSAGSEEARREGARAGWAPSRVTFVRSMLRVRVHSVTRRRRVARVVVSIVVPRDARGE